jgi:outer membrane protein
MATDADVLLAEAALAEAVARRVHAEAAAADAADALGAHLGWPAGRVPVPTDTLPDIPLPDDDRPGPDGRSDLRASEASVDAARGRARQASAGRLPTLEGFAQWSTHAPGLADDRGAHWTAGLRLSVPVFTGFALEASADAARAGARAAEARHDERVRAARLEVERARRGVEAARRALDAAASGGGAAREAARLLRRRYEEGMTTLADLLQAEAGAARLEAAWVDARADLGVAAAALAFALGSPGDPPPTDAATDLPSDPNSREDAR